MLFGGFIVFVHNHYIVMDCFEFGFNIINDVDDRLKTTVNFVADGKERKAKVLAGYVNSQEFLDYCKKSEKFDSTKSLAENNQNVVRSLLRRYFRERHKDVVESAAKAQAEAMQGFSSVNAKNVAIEFRSFSKMAGFTGTRCAYTVVPKEVAGYDSKGNEVQLNQLWNRRQTTKFNGVSYPVQVAAAAVYSDDGKKEIKEIIDYYMENAKVIKSSLEKLGLEVYGGVNSPYIWVKTPNNMDSWAFFDLLLNEANVVGTPGSGFGPSGEGYLRLTAFNTLENTKEAMDRISKLNF